MDPISLIPIHFEQLKELRNGTISYIQIIKRDQTRPPVRPVCRKLGVAKLSEIKSESDLYDALLCVASGQSQKSRDSDFSPHSPYSNHDAKDMLSSRSLDNGSNLFRSQTQINGQQQQLNMFGASGMSPPNTPRESIEQSLDFQTLLECVLYIRVRWDPRDRTQRLNSFAYQFGLDEVYLLTALKRICEIIGCVHLSPNIDLDLVISATKICHKQMNALQRHSSHAIENGHGLLTTARFIEYSQTARSLSSPRESCSLLSAATTNLRNFDGGSPYISPREPVNEIPARMSTRSTGSVTVGNKPCLNGLPASNNSPEFSPRYISDDLSGRTIKMPPTATPIGSPFSMPRGLPTSPVLSITISKQNESDNRNLFNRDNRSVPSTGILESGGVFSVDHQFDRIRTPMGSVLLDSHQESIHNNNTPDSSNQSTPREILDLPRYHASTSLRPSLHLSSNLHLANVYEIFWDQAYKVMYCVVDPDGKSRSFDKLLEFISNIAMSPSVSPTLALALDSVVKKSILEICGKIVSYPVDKSPATSFKSTDNIYSCIGVLKHFIQHSAFTNFRDFFNFSSEQLMYCLSEELKWCASDRSDLNDDIAEYIKELSHNRHVCSVIDQAFLCINNQILLPSEWISDVECIQYRLQKHLDISGLVVERYGASVIGIGNHKEAEAEFIVELPDIETREMEFLNTRKEISRRVSVLENANALQPETQFDKCILFLQECLTDEKTKVGELVSSNNGQENAAATTTSAMFNKLSMDSELFFTVGDKYIENAISEAQHRRKQPQLKALLDNLNYLRSQLHEKVRTLEANKTQTLLNLSCNISQLGYRSVRISNNLQDTMIKFVHHESSSTHLHITCCISLDKLIYPHSSRLISEYYNSDSTGKVRQFAAIIKAFVRENELNTELSSYAWNIMTIHFLLRFGYLDNLQSNELLSANSNQSITRTKVNDIDVTFAERFKLPFNCQEQINRTSLIELLLLFFHYFSYKGDIFSNVFTLRGKGQVIPKFGWSKFKPKLQWRFCLEDPFETGIGESPNDLGSNLTFKGQAKVFKYIRMACFALAGMIAHPRDKLEEYVKDFLSRDKIFSVALASGFNPTNEYPSIVSVPDVNTILFKTHLNNIQFQSSIRNSYNQNDLSSTLQRCTINDYSSSCSSPNDPLRSLRSSPNYHRLGISTHHEDSIDIDRFVKVVTPVHTIPRKNSHPKVPSLNFFTVSGILQSQQQDHDSLIACSSSPKVAAASCVLPCVKDDSSNETFSSIVARSRQVDNIVQESAVNLSTSRDASQIHNLFRNLTTYDALSIPVVSSESSGLMSTRSICGHTESNPINNSEVFEEVSPRLAGWLKSKI